MTKAKEVARLQNIQKPIDTHTESLYIEYMDPISSQSSVMQTGPGKCLSCPNFTFKRVLAFLAVILVVLVMWQWISSPMVVTVYGVGKVSVPATSATIAATVSVNGDTPQNAIAAVKVKANLLKSILVSSGVSEEKISTSQVTSYPANLVVTGATGYQAAIVITAETSNVSSLDDVVGSLYTAGASLVQQPVLNIENEGTLEDQATKEALKDAKSQISKIALRHLKPIRKIVDLYEVDSSTTATATSKASSETSAESEMAAANGVFEVAKSLSVSYKLW